VLADRALGRAAPARAARLEGPPVVSRVVVVGAGVGGLAAAARLAALGHAVTVCEQAPQVGGKLGEVVQTLPAGRFAWDTGPSLLTMPHVFAELFRATGDPIETVLDLVPLHPISRYRFADGTELDADEDFPAALGPAAAADWARFLRRSEAMWAATRGPFLESTVDSPWALARQAVRVRDLATIAPWRTLRGLGRRSFADPRLRTYLDRYATYTGSDPRKAPAALAVVPYVEQHYGGWYVRGGLRRLAEVLLDRCRELGVTVRTATDVVGIETAGGRVSGVRLGKRTGSGSGALPADVVVANADATHLYSDLISAPSALRRLRRATPSLSGFVLLLALRGRTPRLAHHSVLFPADYDAEFDAVFGDPASPVADPTIYVSSPDDPAVRPDGHEAWFVLVNAPRHGSGPGAVDWRAPGLSSAYADRLLGLLAGRGLDVRERVLSCTVRTPYDLERETRSYGGAIYGTSSNGLAAAFLRPANRSPVPGLFLVGGSSHPGGGLPLVALSAQIVADLVGPA